MPSTLPHPAVGSVVARRWRLLQRLGEGGVGEVYSAEPVVGGERVAVKMLREEFRADSAVVTRFVEEGRTCLRLVHPNIARIVDVDRTEDGSAYIATEMLDAVPLGVYTQNGGRVPAVQAVLILQGILAGLAAAHAKGVVHGDLKPDNVFLVRSAAGTFTIKVLDFGMAKVMQAAGGMGKRTRAGTMLGAPAYMSPEQVKNAADVDARTDLFSAGVIFYEMLTGRVAFPAPTEYARLAAVLSTEPEPVEHVDPTLAPLAPIVARALRKNRDQRFPSALEMAHTIASVSLADAPLPDGRVPPGSVAAASPLSRLPQIRSALATSTPALPAPTSLLAQTTPAPAVSTPAPRRHKPGGTLESPAAPQTIADPPPIVAIASMEGTLPSKGMPVIATGRRGVSRLVVALLVAAALGVGFLLGWASARM